MGSATCSELLPHSRQPGDPRDQCVEEDEPKDGGEVLEEDEGLGGEKGRGQAGLR